MSPDTSADAVLSIQGLVTEFRTPQGTVRAVEGVSFDVRPGETVGVVGESGSGKSTAALSVLGLLPPAGRVVGGRALFDGRDLLAMPTEELRTLRGDDVSMIFQDPLTSLNPVLSIGAQVAEAVLVHRDVPERAARDRAAELLASVGIEDAVQRLDQYPHEFSGGMRQRVMIAMAIANEPKLLIADEPTTALDVTVQAQVLRVLAQARDRTGASTILITHDLALLAEMADRVVVMYCGRVVETGDVFSIFREPRHPYTRGLLASRPGATAGARRLPAVPGQPPSLAAPPSGCTFHPRCDLSQGREPCRREEPDLLPVDDTGRASRCHYHHELAREEAR